MVFYFIILVIIGGFFLLNLTLAVITISYSKQKEVKEQLRMIQSEEELKKSYSM